MQTHISRATRIGTLALIGLAAVARGQHPLHLVTQHGSTLTIEGGSNLHSWSCQAALLDGAIDADASIATTWTPVAAKLVQHVQINIPVSEIKCGEGAMDKNLAKALKSESAPVISYVMTTIETVGAVVGDSMSAKVVGTLSIAGVEKPITMDLIATRLANGSLRATGSVPLLMTDFGVKPPTALLGTLRTKDQVVVRFELLVGQKAISAASER